MQASNIEEILELVRYQYKLLNSPENLLPKAYLLNVWESIDSTRFDDKLKYYEKQMLDLQEEVERFFHRYNRTQQEVKQYANRIIQILSTGQIHEGKSGFLDTDKWNEINESIRRILVLVG